MGLFTKKYKMPPGNPQGWTVREVKHFLKHKKLDAYKEAFSHLAGKDLMALDKAQLLRVAGGPAPALVAAVNELRCTWGVAALQDPLPSPAPEPPAQQHALPEPETAQPAPVELPEMTQLILADRVTQESLPEVPPMEVAVVGMLQGAKDYAEALAKFVPAATAEDLASFIASQPGKIGLGLADGAAAHEPIGQLFGASYQLYNTSLQAVVNRDNCFKLGNLGADVLRIIDGACKKQEPANVPAEQLISLINAATGVVQPYTADGWLLHILCHERCKEEFDGAHNAVLEALKAASLDVLPNGKALARGDYRDSTKPVRRLVKQHGSGSLTAGVLKFKGCDDLSEGLRDLAALLEVDVDVLGAELEAVPDSGIDVETYYYSIVARGSKSTKDVHQRVFDWYDKDKSGFIEVNELRAALDDLGLLEGKAEQEAAAFVTANFKAADKAGAGKLDADAFCTFYSTLTTSKARQQLRSKMGLQAEEDLRGIFYAFSSFGSRQEVHDIDNAHFAKLAKDCSLVGGQLSTTDVDLVFAKAKAKGARRMDFTQFLDAVALCAEKKGIAFEDVIKMILAAGGPTAHATKPDNVRLHDDKSTYTGVYSKGGPKTIEPSKDLSTILDRSEADVRGVKKATPAKALPPTKATAGSLDSARRPPMGTPTAFLNKSVNLSASGIFSPAAFAASAGSPAIPARRRSSLGGSNGGGSDLREMFNSFAAFGGSAAQAQGKPQQHALEMDSSKFIKLCRECRLLDKSFNSTRADLVFAKVKQQGHTKIDFPAFQKALEMIAEEKKMKLAELHTAVCNSDGPLLNSNAVRV